MFVDSHCHLHLLKEAKTHAEVEAKLVLARNQGVSHFLCVNVTINEFEAMQKLVAPFNDVSISCGIHPLYVDEDFGLSTLQGFASQQNVVALGETGLDYHYSVATKAKQQDFFIQHIELANQLNKPLIVHTRDARQDTIAILKEHHADRPSGVLHCFTENWAMANAALDLGFYISLSGIVTFKNANDLQEIAKKLPLDRLLIETDSPYLAPVPYRGKENQPSYVVEVAKFLAQLRQEPLEKFAQQTTQNFFNLFKKIEK